MIRQSQPSIKFEDPTIEHILPQNPKKVHWELEASDVKDFVDNVGNLTILYSKDNKVLGNSPMKVKIEKVFSKSLFKMNKNLGKLQKGLEDNPEKTIEERGYELAKKANKIWALK